MSGYCARCAELLRRDLTKRRLQTHERTDGWLRDGARLLCQSRTGQKNDRRCCQ